MCVFNTRCRASAAHSKPSKRLGHPVTSSTPDSNTSPRARRFVNSPKKKQELPRHACASKGYTSFAPHERDGEAQYHGMIPSARRLARVAPRSPPSIAAPLHTCLHTFIHSARMFRFFPTTTTRNTSSQLDYAASGISSSSPGGPPRGGIPPLAARTAPSSLSADGDRFRPRRRPSSSSTCVPTRQNKPIRQCHYTAKESEG